MGLGISLLPLCGALGHDKMLTPRGLSDGGEKGLLLSPYSREGAGGRDVLAPCLSVAPPRGSGTSHARGWLHPPGLSPLWGLMGN